MSEPLYRGLFDDAAMFPPASTSVDKAVVGHARHRLSWYEPFVGPFVSNESRLASVNQHVGRLGLSVVDVNVVVHEGPGALPHALASIDRCEHLRLRAVEVSLGPSRLQVAIEACSRLPERGIQVYIEIPVALVTERSVHELRDSGLYLKLRTGGTTIDAFQSEEELARPIIGCASEMLRFKCTAGLHSAVRHREDATLFQHHGFLNIALATLAAAGTGSHAAVRAILAEHDRDAVAARVRELSTPDVTAIRTLFGCFGTCSIAEPLDDLLSMGLVSAP